MNENGFLALVRKNGRYESHGEASRAAHAVFGTVKAWLSPHASDQMRKALSKDASQLWQYSPVSHLNVSESGGINGSEAANGSSSSNAPDQSSNFILRVQQLGRYYSFAEARRATCSVFVALIRSLTVDPGVFLKQVFPVEVMGACRQGRRAA